MSATVIPFPGKSSRVEAALATTDVTEAFAVAAILIREWQDVTSMVRHGRLQLVGRDMAPIDPPYPAEPLIRFDGEEKPVNAIVDLGRHLDGQALPPPMVALFAIWNCDDPDDPILTYADAVDFIETIIDLVLEEQRETPAKLVGGGA